MPAKIASKRRDIAYLTMGAGFGINLGVALVYYFPQPSETTAFPRVFIYWLVTGVFVSGGIFLRDYRNH